MTGLCESGNEPPGSLKAITTIQWYADNNVHRLDWPAQSPDFNPIEHLWNELDRRLRSREMRPTSIAQLSAMLQEEWRRILLHVVVITEDVQNVHLLLEYRPHIDVSLTCQHDPKLQEYCVCPQNMPQFDSEGIPNQAPETNKPMILNGPTSRNREGSDQVSVEAQAIGPPLPIHRSGNLRSKYRRAVRTTEVCRSAIMQEVNVLTIDQWSVF
ncbi:hypothetical protein ANN_06848 [Periplaneta americana]|uniref:Tc1-like transposase DDE domain-containing protein n=1 Tax=Periplaneta americana TaxID=6978 RepID=A0ABQ8TFB5_PERAM|nr:hypothetical protein ANN_06848 [Periplaneta americana]